MLFIVFLYFYNSTIIAIIIIIEMCGVVGVDEMCGGGQGR